MQGVNTNTMEMPTTRPKAEARNVTWHEVPEWQQDNKYILNGYRPEKADQPDVPA
jgi:adiponectin receptor